MTGMRVVNTLGYIANYRYYSVSVQPLDDSGISNSTLFHFLSVREVFFSYVFGGTIAGIQRLNELH